MTEEEVSKAMELLQSGADLEEDENYEESFDCPTCGGSLLLEQIKSKQQDKTNIWVAYVECPECETVTNLAFDDKATMKLKDKINIARDIRQYLEMEMMIAMTAAEDRYYKHEYSKLTQEERNKIGNYTSHVDKQKNKELRNILKDKKYNLKTLTKLL